MSKSEVSHHRNLLKRDAGLTESLSTFPTTFGLTSVFFAPPNGGNEFSGRRTGSGPEFR